MSADRDLAAELAAEIRAAVAEVGDRLDAAPVAEVLSENEESARAALRGSRAHLTPVIPPATRFEGAKRLAVRALRFLWREQASFNARQIEAGEALLRALAEQRDAFRNELADLRRELVRRSGETLDEIRRLAEKWERRAAIQDGRLGRLESGAAESPPTSWSGPLPPLAPGLYALFEERFRGSPGDVERKQRSYLEFLRGLPGPVLDIGCGRGEFLELLRAEGIAASGVDVNPISVSLCRSRGLEVREGDGIAALTAYPAASLGGVVAFQVVEHWPAEATLAFLREARRALAPGGVLIAETINTDSLSALKAFFLDPSHVRAVPPEALRFLAEAAGFPDVRIEYRSDVPAEQRLGEASDNDRKLNALLFGPQDYAVVARVPTESRQP